MKTKEEISRYLTEKVLGKCWHEWVFVEMSDAEEPWEMWQCNKCEEKHGSSLYSPHNFRAFTPEGIFALIKAGREKDWWEEFDDKEMYQWSIERGTTFNYDNLENFPEVMYKFLKEREEK